MRQNLLSPFDDVIFSAHCGYGKQAAMAYAVALRGKSSLVFVPRRSIAEGGVYDMRRLGLRSFKIDGDTTAAEAKRLLGSIDSTDSADAAVVFTTMTQMVKNVFLQRLPRRAPG